MARDFSGYSIAQLNEGLAVIDGRKNPENKAAKEWGHWAAVAVLGIQVLRVESENVMFNFLSSIGLFAFYAEGGDIGFSVEFDPGFLIAMASGADLLVGVNLFVVGLLVILTTARQKVA